MVNDGTPNANAGICRESDTVFLNVSLGRINETKIAHLNEIVDFDDATDAPVVEVGNAANLTKLGLN
jgi:hypothetical protein